MEIEETLSEIHDDNSEKEWQPPPESQENFVNKNKNR
jgi:hypothetical protein